MHPISTVSFNCKTKTVVTNLITIPINHNNQYTKQTLKTTKNQKQTNAKQKERTHECIKAH
jgi:hypothetical protein